jgi:hypothetical protein
VPTADLAITLVLFVTWYAVLRTPLVDLAPAPIRERMPRLASLEWRPRDREGRARGWPISIALLVASALVGIATHLAWDAFTHRDSPLVIAWPALRVEVGPLHLWSWLQLVSSVAGLLIIAVWAARWVSRTAPIADRQSRASSGVRIAAWLAVIVAFGGAGFVIWILGIRGGLNPFDGGLMFGVATRAGAAAGLVAVIITAAWWVAYGRRSPAEVELAD